MSAYDNIAAYDLKPEQFPFRIRCIDMDTEEVLQETVVHGPDMVKIEGWAPRKVKVEMTYPNGMQFIEGPGISEVHQIRPVPRF